MAQVCVMSTHRMDEDKNESSGIRIARNGGGFPSSRSNFQSSGKKKNRNKEKNSKNSDSNDKNNNNDNNNNNDSGNGNRNGNGNGNHTSNINGNSNSSSNRNRMNNTRNMNRNNNDRPTTTRKYHIPPKRSPSPFELSNEIDSTLLMLILEFSGDPVVVCRMKCVNRCCKRLVNANYHIIMRDAVRLGGLSMNLRPAFWMWITLELAQRREQDFGINTNQNYRQRPFMDLEQMGKTGKWANVIERDVARSFGNMPPHKTGARLRTDSIVRALVTYGRGRLIKRGVKGSGMAPPLSEIDSQCEQSLQDHDLDGTLRNENPTVSDWEGVSPVPSFASSTGEDLNRRRSTLSEQPLYETCTTEEDGDASIDLNINKDLHQIDARSIEELALSGNTLTTTMKADLQDKLGFILYALAASHEDVGYCQGMDYVVAHLLRVLQDTVRWKAARGMLPDNIHTAKGLANTESTQDINEKSIRESHVVEEAVFRVMDCFFTTYNLRHMYWPELRCLKTCCRVFERLIKFKLPVLADHFEHHELNVGLFALGWFQTLFLYLPSMPSATVCHMWDIWLVERSFKIFFRVGTAILFLSQPILLNHDLEGMMTYLNTFPDATLLNPDILISCALQIKVTNRMLAEIELEQTLGI